MMKKIQTLFAFVLTWMFAASAIAADPFTVAGVPVDANGDTAIEAQTTAMTEGQTRAAEILIERLTVPSELQVNPPPEMDAETAAKLIRALEVANEKRSANRYLGDITVAFNPSKVQAYLQQNGLTMLTSQARNRLVIPVLEGNPLWVDNPWIGAWSQDSFDHALTPVKSIKVTEGDSSVIDAETTLAIDMDALKRVGQRYGLNQILIAEARPTGAGVFVNVTDVAIDSGQQRNLGSFRGDNYWSAAKAVVDGLENDWKQASVSLTAGATQLTVSVLYDSLSEWLGLQDVINGSSLIQDARLDALSKDGALMTLVYGGDLTRLQTELSYKGVEIKNDPALGVILAKTGRY